MKLAFFGLLILCLLVVISFLRNSNNQSTQSGTTRNADFMYVKIAPPVFSEDMLDSNFESCLFSNSLNFSYSNVSTLTHGEDSKSGKHPLINTLLEFSEISQQLGVETVLIEPSLLFCILSPSLQSLLLRRNFTLSNESSEHVLTMGIFQKDAVILEKKAVQNQLAEIGFHIEIVESPILSWMKLQGFLNSSMFTSHVFLQKDKWVLHLVVFHKRESFLWHAALSPQADFRTPTEETLLFVEADAAFENFTAVSLGFKVPRLENVNIPTNPASFLYQIETSRFLECNETIVNLYRKQPISAHPSQHQYPNFSPHEFNQRLIIAIEELKINLDPLLIRFWLFSGTLLGWHRQCDVIPYTSDADFATWAVYGEEVDKLMDDFKQNEHLTAIEKLGMIDVGLEYKFRCHGLGVDLFFIYEEENGTWCGSHGSKESGYYMKYYYPDYSLCSAELLGQKINLPCEPESVILADYGVDWMQPVSSWSYERSPKNRGPNIFWEKSLLNKVYKHY